MKPRTLLASVLAAAILAVNPIGAAFAHGEPVIRVDPPVVAAGGSITVTGTEMEPGEVFDLALESAAISISLGQAAVEGEGEEGGFVVTLTLPGDLAPGSYRLRASTEEGESAVADLTVTAASSEASAGPATVQEASAEPHVLERRKPAGQVAAVALLAAASVLLGLWLIRRR
jgi:hypothetical protein